MNLTKYKIICLPFQESDLEKEYEEYGKDEEDALAQFRENYPAFRVKSVIEA
jgi:hypothetical protein